MNVYYHFIHKYQINKKMEKDSTFVDGGFPFGPSLALGVLIAYIISYFHIFENWPLSLYY